MRHRLDVERLVMQINDQEACNIRDALTCKQVVENFVADETKLSLSTFTLKES